MSIKTLGPFTGRQLTTIIVAVIVAVAIPTAAYGFTVGHTAVTDATSKATASVTPTGNLQVAVAAPSAFVQTRSVGLGFSGYSLITAAPAGSALIVTFVHLDVYANTSPGSGQYAQFLVLSANCTGPALGTFAQIVNPTGIGEIDVPLGPGLGVPAGDALCGILSGGVSAEASVSGYTVPSASVPALATHALPALPTQHR